MRKFYLENQNGERRSLNGDAGVWLQSPTGLGDTLAPAYADLTHGFFRSANADAHPQSAVSGELRFTGRSPYSDYRALYNWIMAATRLYLVYCPYGSAEYRRLVELAYLTKTELAAAGWLLCPVSFSPLTPWFLPSPVELIITAAEGTELRYDFRYTSDLRYGSDSSASYTATIAQAGQAPAGLRLQYTGAITGPVLLLRGERSGELLGRCAIDATLGSTDTLEISTTQEDSYVRKRSASGAITDLLHLVDLSFDPFPRCSLSESSVLELTAATAFSGPASLQVYYYYGSV